MNITLLIMGISLAVMAIILFLLSMRYKKKLQIQEEELTLFKKEKEYISEAMMVLSENYDVIFANQSAKVLFSLDNKYHKMANARAIELKVDTSDPDDFFEVLKYESEKREDTFHLQNVLLVINGKMKQVNIYVDKSAWNTDKTITCIIDMQAVVPTEAKSLQKDGGVDFFTGLPSQFSALTDINSLVIKMQKSSESFSLFLLGIDHFNELQTTLGVGFSNQIIKDVAEYFKKESDNKMHSYRMDCDKFLLVIEKSMDDTEAHEIAKKMILDLQNNESENVHLTTSVGIVHYPTHGENATKLVNHVYIALNEAQQESDSNIEFFTTAYKTMGKDDLKINEEIQLGLKNHEFFLYYQPIFNLKTEEMIGAEALLRWNHPQLGIVSADKFLQVAERTGLIIDIGEYVFREAIKQRRVWDDIGLKKFKITLNLSLKEMHVDKLIQKLETLFEDNAVNPRDFNLDITESSAMANTEKTAMDFKLFKDLGLSLSLDHFGASASSIKHLQMLPLSMIKIDRSLIFDLYSNLDHQITVKSMIKLIHSLGFEVVGEGVETSKESALLYDFGCDHAQGYLFSKPLPAKELEELLK
ncbi:MAG TPA: bifunctional diguanylate cyclase/phosphodiesterase [Epsilonproteobacteria bacterium]|nr:bifunctional diguanylate cyclase/phosphodiesterase [Campylobacterota bacterium]